jgi:hypothetical protein
LCSEASEDWSEVDPFNLHTTVQPSQQTVERKSFDSALQQKKAEASAQKRAACMHAVMLNN